MLGPKMVTISGITISDLFFNSVEVSNADSNSTSLDMAKNFLEAYPEFLSRGITAEELAEDFDNRL
jgi:hypothetical protein